LLGLRQGRKQNLMLGHEDLKWLAANASELNRLLQQAARQAEQARLRTGVDAQLNSLGDQIERAARSSQAIFDRITGRMPGAAGSVSASSPALESRRELSGIASPSLFTRMPVGEVAMAEESSSVPLIRNPKGQREFILLVDDDRQFLEVTGEILDFEDYRFITASDGIEALQIYRRLGREIDLVLLDYFLPVIDGDAVFDELKAINPDVRVVLSSGFGEQARVGFMLARGLCGFIPKPYTAAKLIEQIRLVLDA
jgi:CheY-like chemotaxis protein